MILQSALEGDRWFAMFSVDHALAAEQIARAFPLGEPEVDELVATAVRHHEEGWRVIDRPVLRNPDTGLPYQPSETPHPLHVLKAIASAEWNERRHPFCGLLVSMHGVGVYGDRLGLSDKHVVEHVPPEDRPLVERLLAYEKERQERLRGQLGDLARDDLVQRSFALQEFADTLALYFQQGDPPERWSPEVFPHVPLENGAGTDVVARPVDQGVITLEPYPFSRERIELTCVGRWLTPQESDEDLAAALEAAPIVERRYSIVRSQG